MYGHQRFALLFTLIVLACTSAGVATTSNTCDEYQFQCGNVCCSEGLQIGERDTCCNNQECCASGSVCVSRLNKCMTGGRIFVLFVLIPLIGIVFFILVFVWVRRRAKAVVAPHTYEQEVPPPDRRTKIVEAKRTDKSTQNTVLMTEPQNLKSSMKKSQHKQLQQSVSFQSQLYDQQHVQQQQQQQQVQQQQQNSQYLYPQMHEQSTLQPYLQRTMFANEIEGSIQQHRSIELQEITDPYKLSPGKCYLGAFNM